MRWLRMRGRRSDGRHLSYIMQGSMNVLNPVRRIRHSFMDFAFRHMKVERSVFFDRVASHLQRLKLDPQLLDAYPHELSGGMRQRMTIALATILTPEFIIADEPTTALDVIVQRDVLSMIREIQREMGSSFLFVTHDMGVHAAVSDRIGIVYAGRLVEEAPTRKLFQLPLHPYTQHLVGKPAAYWRRIRSAFTGRAAAQSCHAARGLPFSSEVSEAHGYLQPGGTADGLDRAGPACGLLCRDGRPDLNDLLSLSHVTKVYRQGGLLGRRHITAVRDVSLTLGEEPEILSIVGESGSGKSTIAAMILGQTAPTEGRLEFSGRPVAVHGRVERRAFMREVQPVLQNPFEAFNPLKRVDRYLFETAKSFAPDGKRPSRAEVERMADVALVAYRSDPWRGERPISPRTIGRPIAAHRDCARADTATPASGRRRARFHGRRIAADGDRQPLQPIEEANSGLSIIYITHDLATAYYISDRIIIMKKGEIVEEGKARAVLDNPQHPYSQALKDAVLSTTPEDSEIFRDVDFMFAASEKAGKWRGVRNTTG